MFGTHDLLLFITSGLLLNMAPGPDSLLIMSRSASQGWRAGSAAALGIGTGTLIHIFAAALGLSAVLATSSAAFSAVKYIGAGYLLYIGIRLILSKSSTTDSDQIIQPTSASYSNTYIQGFLTNVLNPKIAIFFLAFVPQFIDPNTPNKALSFIARGLIFNLNGMLWCHFLAISTAFASQRFKTSQKLANRFNRLTGIFFVSLGVKLALSKHN